MFAQIHTLTGYSSVLLNRDDTGMAKRAKYGNAVRTRTSSQFAKSKLRKVSADVEYSVANLGDLAVRSRETFKREIALKLIEEGLEKAPVVYATVAIMDAVFKLSEGAKKDRKEKEEKIAKGEADIIILLERGELNILSRSEIEFMKGLVRQFATDATTEQAVKAANDYLANREFKANLVLAGKSMSLDMAMFGRMVTGDVLSGADAAVNVAHAITTHAQATEVDFFTAVDDLVTGIGDKGGAHLGETEITSPLLYGNYVLDMRQLFENLKGVDNRTDVAARLSRNLVHLVAEYVVGAKKGSTAPYSSADLVLVEIGTRQPRTLAEAFRNKVGPTLGEAVSAMESYLRGKDRMYGGHLNERLVASTVDLSPVFGAQMCLPDLADAVAGRVATAGAAFSAQEG